MSLSRTSAIRPLPIQVFLQAHVVHLIVPTVLCFLETTIKISSWTMFTSNSLLWSFYVQKTYLELKIYLLCIETVPIYLTLPPFVVKNQILISTLIGGLTGKSPLVKIPLDSNEVISLLSGPQSRLLFMC